MRSEYVSVSDFSKQIGVTPAAVYNWLQLSRIRGKRVCGRHVIPRSEINRVRGNLANDLPVALGLDESTSSAKVRDTAPRGHQS